MEVVLGAEKRCQIGGRADRLEVGEREPWLQNWGVVTNWDLEI